MDESKHTEIQFNFNFFPFVSELPDNLTTPQDDCPNKITIEAGCDIVNRKCKCWETMNVCKTQDHKLRWDFKNMEVSERT